ncbi:hypothetical protein [Streptomyces sp. NPDC052496]|uniref:hypothetical protein n=1 Tax=Streptomyces sp. NPDC052496 TaxID=3154951 RepID=UPI00343C3AB1
MADAWTLGEETAARYAKYRRALKTAREMKEEIRQLALEDLRAGASTEALAALTGETAEVYRRLARAHDIEPPAAYKGRAELFRQRARQEDGEDG